MKNTAHLLILLILVFASAFLTDCTPKTQTEEQAVKSKSEYLVYIGTYTGPKSRGIYAYRFDAETGQLTSLGLAAEAVNPSFLAVDPTHQFLYAVNELGDYGGPNSGGVSAFSINPATGRLVFLNEVRSRGPSPLFVSLYKTGRYALMANYCRAMRALFAPLEGGRLGEPSAFVQHKGHSVNPARQKRPHAHCIRVSPDNRFALAADLGLDKLLVYKFDASSGTLTPNDPPSASVKPGLGPRHFVFSPNGKFVYVISEIGSAITAFSYDEAAGTLKPLQTISTLPKDYKGENNDAEVQIAPSGKFLYGSNRGADSIAVFAIDPDQGTLTPIEYVPTGGKEPRNFEIGPTGKYLFAANQNSDDITLFRIDPETGKLTPTGTVVHVGSPVSVAFVPLQ